MSEIERQPDGEVLDSLWGIYGSDYAGEEAWAAFDSIVKKEEEAAFGYACRC